MNIVAASRAARESTLSDTIDGMERKAIPLRQVAIANVLIATAWLAWGFTGISAVYRECEFYETWWLYPTMLGPSIVAAAFSLFGFHKRAAIWFGVASLVAGTHLWLFVVAPFWVLIQDVLAR